MKVTGIALLVIGIAAAIFCVINLASTPPADATKVGTASSSPQASVPPVVVPLVVAIAGIGAGGGMLLFGRRGYDHIPSPAVRN